MTRHRMLPWLVLVALLIASPAAADKKDPHPPPMPVPPVFRGAEASNDPNSLGDYKWFDVFKDPQLKTLIQTALRQNASLRLAVTRVDAERANLQIVRASHQPAVTLGANFSTNTVSTNSPNFVSAFEQRTVALGEAILNFLPFEIDVWGRLRRQTDAAQAQLRASEEDRRTVMTVVVTDVASLYFTLLELDSELDIDQRTLAARSDSLLLINAREQGGLASMLDVRQGQELVQQAALTVTQTKQLIDAAENTLNQLLGNPPGPVARGQSLAEQTIMPEVPAGLPSALLVRRPDIRSAELNVEAQHFLVASARAAFLPQVSLTGFMGYQSDALQNLFTRGSYTTGVAPSITGAVYPIAGLQANLALVKANQQQALITYQATILGALHDVSTALVQYSTGRELLKEQEDLVVTLKDRAALAYLRYRGGVDSLLNALDADRELFGAQLSTAQTRRDQLLALVQLYKALGGGWQEQAPEPAPKPKDTSQTSQGARPGP